MAETSSELNLRELRILDALCTNAASRGRRSCWSPRGPTSARCCVNLRAQFADPLFVRNGHAMQPTARALEMADQLRTLLGAVDGLRATVTAFDPVQSERTFNLLLTDVGMIRFLPPLIAHVAAIAPRDQYPGDAAELPPVQSSSWKRGEAQHGTRRVSDSLQTIRRRRRLFFDGYVTVVRNGHPRFPRCDPAAAFSPNVISSSRHRRPVTPRTETAQRVLASQIRIFEYPAAGPELRCRRRRRGRNRCSRSPAGKSCQEPRRAARADRFRNPDCVAPHRDFTVLA